MISIKECITKIYKNKSTLYLDILTLIQENKIEFIIINLPLYYNNDKIPNDIDIVLDEENFQKAKLLLKKLSFEKLDRFINSNQEAFIKYNPNECEFIRIHLHNHFDFYGQKILSYQEIKDNSFENDGFLYPDKFFEKSILLFESFFRKKSHYYKRIKEIDSKQFSQEIKFKNKYSNVLFEKLIVFFNREKHVSSIEQIVTMMKIFKNIKLYQYIFKKIILKISTLLIFRKKGKLVFILGIDGSGKSTISQEVVNKIESGGYLTKYSYWGLKVTLLQKFKNLFKKSQNINVKNKTHTLKIEGGIVSKINQKSKLIGSIFYFILSTIYVIDYWLLIFKGKSFISIENNYLIVDRSYYDKLYDTSILAHKLFYYCLPKPDLIIRLNGDLNTFYERKKEFNVDDLKILNNRVDNIINYCNSKNIPNMEIDTTENNLIDSVCTILNHIDKEHNAKY